MPPCAFVLQPHPYYRSGGQGQLAVAAVWQHGFIASGGDRGGGDGSGGGRRERGGAEGVTPREEPGHFKAFCGVVGAGSAEHRETEGSVGIRRGWHG